MHDGIDAGTVYWITGLSGAGKTTIGQLFYWRLKKIRSSVVYLDGDVLRQVFGSSYGHTQEDRKNLAMQYSQLCNMLSGQSIDVVCATISMFRDIRKWNRTNISRYFEIYLKVPIEILIERDQKQLYSRALRGEILNVMGVDLEIEEPEAPDLTILNDGSKKVDEIVEDILDAIKQEK